MPGAGGAGSTDAGGGDKITKSWDVIAQFQALNTRSNSNVSGSGAGGFAMRRMGSNRGGGGGEGGEGGGQGGGGGGAGATEQAKGTASAIKDELESKSAYMKQVRH